MNILIDPLPKKFEGYLINWQFYNGIIISNCLASDKYPQNRFGQIAKIHAAFEYLFGKGIPNFETAIRGLNWFLSCGKSTLAKNDQSDKIFFSFNDDKERIFSAFMVKFGINLNKDNSLHWFEFVTLMNDLHKTAFRNVVDLRMMTANDMKGYSAAQKREILRQKQYFAIKKALNTQFTDGQKNRIENFQKLVGNEKN
jgi:hypothetical protein